jgi:beta-glucosidase
MILRNKTLIFLIFAQIVFNGIIFSQKAEIYRKGWIDLNKNGQKDLYEDPTQDIEKRVANLLSQMTVEEKTCQTATLYGYGRVLQDKQPTPEWKNEIWKDGIANIDEHLNGVKNHTTFVSNEFTFPYSKHAEAINTVQKWFIEETRLGIPVDFSNEGIHGLNHDRATPLPAPIAIASTWNKSLVYKAGQIVGREAKALGYTNVYTPILDVSRDQRWGRIVETYGEDPYLIASLGSQMVKGIHSEGTASTLKHFAIYSIPKGGRDGNVRTDPHVSPRELHELHLYPFRKVIEETHPEGVMSSYNDWNGEPVSSSHYFLTELLRQKYGFNGYVVSDSKAVEFVELKHKVAESYDEAVKQVMEAGLNVRTGFSPPSDYIIPMRKIILEGKLSMATLDRNVADVLRVKFKMGLFDSPYVKNPKLADEIVASPDTKEFVLDMARQSIVLLKNANNILPLDINKYKNILVTGPLATATSHIISRYGPSNIQVTSIFDGLKNYVGKQSNISYVKGCDITDPDWPESEIIPTPLSTTELVSIDSAVKAAQKSDVIIVVVGENENIVGESRSRTSLDLPGRQNQLVQALKATGKPVIMVMVNGHPLSVNWANRFVDGILETWFSNSSAGQALAETVFGSYCPGGRLPVTFPKTVGQIEYNFPFKQSSQSDESEAGTGALGGKQIFGPLYPFGYGLSYTSFGYSNLIVTPEKQGTKGLVNVTLDITNTGKFNGDEVVQLYVKDLVSSVTTYEYVLRGFERVTLNKGETKNIRFVLTPDDLSILNKNMEFIVEPGKFEVMIGSSSIDIKLKKTFEIID